MIHMLPKSIINKKKKKKRFFKCMLSVFITYVNILGSAVTLLIKNLILNCLIK